VGLEWNRNGVGAVSVAGDCSIAAVRGISKTSMEFRGGLNSLAKKLGVNVDWLAAVIAFESGFDPAAKNPNSSATGLIQFMRNEAIKFGTTVEDLAQMTREEQLPYVEKYFNQHKGRLKDLCSTYFAVFAPVCIGKSLDYVAYAGGSAAYRANAAIDKDNSGNIECRDICNQITGVLAAAGDRRVPAPCSGTIGGSKSRWPLFLGVSAAALGVAYWRGWIP
jgi:hypothetical protein